MRKHDPPWSIQSMKLSVTIATKNEAVNIEKCLQAVAFAHEIVVDDDLGTDDTAERARAFGARVIPRDSRGSFHENKNLAIKEATGEWVLSLDADEIITQSGLQIPLNLLLRPSHKFLKKYMLQGGYR